MKQSAPAEKKTAAPVEVVDAAETKSQDMNAASHAKSGPADATNPFPPGTCSHQVWKQNRHD